MTNRFENFFGNERIVDSLKKSIEIEEYSHSYIFSGIEGIGKFTLANIFAKELLTSGEDDLNPIFDEDGIFLHPDLKVIKSADKSIKKAQIEEIVEEASLTPYKSKYKIFIIDEFEKVTPEGQNALLKTLEEPSKYIKLIIITSNEGKIIPTIISRCRLLRFTPLRDELILDYLVKVKGIEREEALIFSKLSKGSVAKALEYSTNLEFLSLRNKSLDILDNIIKSKGYYPLKAYSFFEENKENIHFILQNYLTWFRDLVMLIESESFDNIINLDKRSLLETQIFIGTTKGLKIIEEIIKRFRDIDTNVNYQLAMETLLLYIQGDVND